MNQVLNSIDRRTEAIQAKLQQSQELTNEFYSRLDLSWIYHDNALEGIVLSFSELNAAIDEAIISDSTLIPTYDEVQNHKEAIELVRETANKKKTVFGLDYLKKLHHVLSIERTPRSGKAPPKPPAGQYRKDNPLHRMYFHEIAQPEKISYQMRKIISWLTSEEAKTIHPIKRAALAHYKLIAIFPWPRYSGKVARLLMNAMLLRDGYLPAIVHAIERQRYYEVLRQPPETLIELIIESCTQTLESAEKFIEMMESGELQDAQPTA